MRKKSFAEALAAGASGVAGGAQAGAAAGPWGALAGGLAGGLLGGVGGYMDGEAQAPFDKLNLQEQDLNNQLLQTKVRTAQTAQKGFDLFRGYLGNAFKAANPSTFAGALKPYPGLGNQAVQ
jgi:hypothetical protein